MKIKDIESRVKHILEEVSGKKDFKSNDLLKEKIGLDSLSIVSVIVGLEEEFQVEFDDGALEPAKLRKVSDLIGLVKSAL